MIDVTSQQVNKMRSELVINICTKLKNVSGSVLGSSDKAISATSASEVCSMICGGSSDMNLQTHAGFPKTMIVP